MSQPETSLDVETNGAARAEPGPPKAHSHKARSHKASDADTHDSPNLHKYTAESAIYQWHLRQVMEVLHEALAETAPQTVLDADCGEGFVTRFLARREAAGT